MESLKTPSLQGSSKLAWLCNRLGAVTSHGAQVSSESDRCVKEASLCGQSRNTCRIADGYGCTFAHILHLCVATTITATPLRNTPLSATSPAHMPSGIMCQIEQHFCSAKGCLSGGYGWRRLWVTLCPYSTRNAEIFWRPTHVSRQSKCLHSLSQAGLSLNLSHVICVSD